MPIPKVAVQLLIGQNEEPFLPYAIRSVSWADYFTVCNTSPETDIGRKNEAIVRQEIPSEKLRLAELHPDSNGHFSFADARNLCLKITDLEDFVLIVDADDVHYDTLEELLKGFLHQGYDSLTAYFYHLMVYKDIYQYVQPREIGYTNYENTHWEKGVHELLRRTSVQATTMPYWYLHYGYVKPQREVFKRWKFYSDLEGDFAHYDGQNPDHILDDRITVSKPLPINPPSIISEYLDTLPGCPPGELRESPKVQPGLGEERVGLVLLTMNDAEQLETCLATLSETLHQPEFSVLAIDIGSTDNSVEILQKWQSKIPMEIVGTEGYVSLAEALNYGFDHFRQIEAYEYVGWIHPDMEFIQPTWLRALWETLQLNPKIGKISAANYRDIIPEEIIDGHEQCYIMRKDILHKIGLFDEKYIGIGGYEDWDLNRRILQHSGPNGYYEVKITPKAWVLHHGMQTRSRRDTRDEQVANARYYYEKWNTNLPPV